MQIGSKVCELGVLHSPVWCPGTGSPETPPTLGLRGEGGAVTERQRALCRGPPDRTCDLKGPAGRESLCSSLLLSCGTSPLGKCNKGSEGKETCC